MITSRVSWIAIAASCTLLGSAPPKSLSKSDKPQPQQLATPDGDQADEAPSTKKAAAPRAKAASSSPLDRLRVAGWSVELTPPGTPYLAIAIGPSREGGPSVVTISTLPEGVMAALAAPDADKRLGDVLGSSAGPLQILQVSPPTQGRSWEVAAVLSEEKPPRFVQFMVLPGEPGNLVTLVTTKAMAEKVAEEVRVQLVRAFATETRLSTRKE